MKKCNTLIKHLGVVENFHDAVFHIVKHTYTHADCVIFFSFPNVTHTHTHYILEHILKARNL